MEVPKDSEGRWVKASPALLAALRVHLEAIDASIAQTSDTYGHVQPDRHEATVNGPDQYLK